MKKERLIPHRAGSDIIIELATRLYPSILQPFREAISNSIDEKSTKCEISLLPDKITFEDWGEGIKDFDKFTYYGLYQKREIEGDIIGRKGLGKLSLMMLGSDISIYTNNGQVGMYFKMTPEGFTKPRQGSPNSFISHKGTMIIIHKPKVYPLQKELVDYLENIFDIKIAHGLEIIVNNSKLKVKTDFKEQNIFRSKDFEITGNLIEDEKGRGALKVYINHVHVTTISIAPDLLFSGWVNCNALEPTTDRNDIVRDNKFNEVLVLLKKYVYDKFPRRDFEVTRSEIAIVNNMAKMLKGYLRYSGLYPEGSMQVNGGGGVLTSSTLSITKKEEKEEKGKEVKKKVPEYTKLRVSVPEEKLLKHQIKTRYGTIWWVDNDPNHEPIYFDPPNMIYYSKNNPLWKFVIDKSEGFGPHWIRFIPYLARVSASIYLWKSKKENDVNEFKQQIDLATHFFLKEHLMREKVSIECVEE